MKLESIDLNPQSLKKSKAIALILNKGEIFPDGEKINHLLDGKVKELIEANDFKKGVNPIYLPIAKNQNSNCNHLVVLSIDANTNSYQFANLISQLAQKVVATSVNEVLLAYQSIKVENLTDEQVFEQIALGFANAAYKFDQHHSKKSDKALTKVSLASSAAIDKKTIDEVNAEILGLNLCKDLGNQPSNICTPTYFANQAKKLASKTDLSIEILNESEMKKLKMGSLLCVSKGSVETPKMIFLNYQGASKKEKPIALVGKGVCFDTGGISIKPSGAMDEMKFDMCGAASVIGVMKAISEAKLKVNVIGVMAMVENMPSGNATKPGDVVKAYNGKTVEILNTDAEGRLVLADALSYTIEKYQPKKIVNIATLTGLVAHFFGTVYSCTFGNDQALVDQLIDAGNESLDLTWQAPLHPGYEVQLKSNFADLPNIGSGKAGSITAAHFLEAFVGKSKWAHLDIAGVAWHSGDQKGSTGRPVNLLYHWVKKNQK